ncbi:PGF-pre-PGF domain-containing protein [Methanosarcina sp.]|jgi:PGF-pre-PGF domain-containing protein|uniref:PGF-pre-PGF domain-containing protein n=1 Tax=Methanosarcina sp. TaxID=2213 RepID=UPI002B7E7217|nr:PGF-pre-PGF domain-containing protein [Methanosarcina sp.]HOW13771.1 PGF-pre-PGF domain-containing protein [Methanosarcina sp.]
MKFSKLKPYVKYGLFLLFVLSLAGTAYADANQLVYYNWCEDTGNTIIDNSGHGNNGINYGSTAFILPTGQTARHFNGQNRITIPENEQLTFTDPHITFGVFFSYNCSNPTNCTYLVSKGNNTCSILIDHTNSTIIYEIYADGHTISGYSECQIEPYEDYEAIVTYDGSHAQLYINGIASGKGVDYTATVLGSSYDTNSWTIGSSSDSSYGLDGTIYAFYAYNRTLNSSEILDLYVNDIHSIRDSNRPGGIALSWDDTGHIDTCYKYLSIFQKYNAACTINVNKISNREIPTQTLVDELNALHSAGWEIAAHGYNHTNSRLFLINNTSAEWLDQEIYPNIVEITCYGYPVYTLAYPYSDRTTDSDNIAAPYFRTLRTGVPDVINNNVNETPLAYYDWDNDRLLYGVEIDEHTDTSLQSIESGIDYAIATDKVLVLYGHTITPNVTDRYQVSTARLDEILNYTSQHGGVFYRMGDLGNSSWVRPARFSNVTANYTVSANNIFAGKNVTFTDYSSNQTVELLDFGDGSPVSTTANVTHVYTTPGTYAANLTVTNDVSSDSMLQTITVVEPATPIANFTSNCTKGHQPLSVAFTDTSTGVRTSWVWDFGDGNTSKLQNPEHEYSAVGSYSVTLTVSNEEGSNQTRKENYITVLPQPPSADFYSDVKSGNAPLKVQFCDTSTGAPVSWNWDFGDGSTSTEQNPVHTYYKAGTFNVNLVVGNAGGTSSKTASITVEEDDDDGGSNGGSGGGGGGGGSPEPAKNVEVKELSQVFISNGNHVNFKFPKNATAVVDLSFDAKKTAGKTTTIVEMLKNKSTLTPEAPQGEVYRYLNIWVGNEGYATEKNVENAAVSFRVKKSWIGDKDIDQSSIILNRYSDKKWNELPTTLLGGDDRYLYFISETPGFSPFAITAKKIVIEKMPDNEEQNGNIESVVEKESEQKENTSISQKESLKTPGFEIIYCIIGLFGVFRYKRR